MVTSGNTIIEPLPPTSPMSLSIVTVSALEDDHVRRDDVPAIISMGLADRLTDGG